MCSGENGSWNYRVVKKVDVNIRRSFTVMGGSAFKKS